ncbi:MAG: diguanylate cyclase [Spirochaetes bacterium]|nr:diguanylate cyclase [Spirochaetota bacterium]
MTTTELGSFFNNINDMLIVCTAAGDIVFVNDAAVRVLGYPFAELIRKNIYDLPPKDEHDEASAVLHAMFTGERNNCSLEFAGRDERRIPVSMRMWPDRWNDMDCVFCLSRDVSGEHESLELFTRFFDANPALMAVMSFPEGIFTDVNASFLAKLGYTKDEIIGKRPDDIGLFPDAAQRITDTLAATGHISDSTLTIRTRDDTVLHVRFSGDVLGSGGKKYILMTMTDITGQMLLSQKADELEQRINEIVTGAQIGTWNWNVETGAMTVNERWAEIFGSALAELPPVTNEICRRLMHPDDLKESDGLLEQHFSRKSEYYDCEIRLRHRNGDWVWVRDRGRVIERDAEGRPLRMFGTRTDITERKKLEAQISEHSIRDALTNIYNRRHVFERLDALADEFRRDKKSFAVIIIDIDHFKKINDAHGHQTGDYILQEMALIIGEYIRPYDIFGRYGGEEFIIVYSGTREEAASSMKRIHNAVGEHTFMFREARIHATFSCGIADCRERVNGGNPVAAILEKAETRLIAAKRSGRNRIVVSD